MTELICCPLDHKSAFTLENAVFEESSLNAILRANSSSLVKVPISVITIRFSWIFSFVLSFPFFGAADKLSSVSCFEALRLFGIFFALYIVITNKISSQYLLRGSKLAGSKIGTAGTNRVIGICLGLNLTGSTEASIFRVLPSANFGEIIAVEFI
jgi:hypothetical protein